MLGLKVLRAGLGLALLAGLSLGVWAESLIVQERAMNLDDYARPAFEESYLIDAAAFLPDLIHEINEARYSIYLDFYIIGGPEFDAVVDLMNEKRLAGVDVRILFDRRLGTISTHGAYMKESMRRIKAYGIPFYLSSNQPFGTDKYSRPYDLNPVDHNKFVVIDRRVAYIGSANPIPSMQHFFDLMFLVKGKVVRRLHQQFLFDFESAVLQARGLEYDTSRCDQPWLKVVNGLTFESVRVFSNGYCRLEIKPRLLELIDNAQEQIDILMQELSYVPEVMDALERAAGRGVSVRVLIGPTDPTDVVEGFIGEALLPKGITVARGGQCPRAVRGRDSPLQSQTRSEHAPPQGLHFRSGHSFRRVGQPDRGRFRARI